MTAASLIASYVNVNNIYMGRAMDLVAKLDEQGKTAWIVVMVLGFIIFWPIGLAILGYLIWSGRMGCWRGNGRGRWHNERKRERWGRSGTETWFGSKHRPPSSGNSAFDEYREETLRRLEDEQKEFLDFLERLRQAKDKAEFDQFMAERRNRPPRSDVPPGAPDPSEGPAPQPQA